ncbi:MAG: class A beta-lactamase-related serine hydrolase, partial [Bacteroidia bacterium]|nr:class A beta-lactamase-related serine hydrolase [Bacteroidia bacterium]
MRSCLLLVLMLIFSCAEESEFDPLQAALASDNRSIQRVMDSLEQYEVQIKLTTISRSPDSVVFDEFQFQLNDSMYFYPASSVKFPVAILALEKLQKDSRLDLDTPFFVEGDSSFTTMRSDIRDIFAVSSNDTFNRLFEYLGKDSINNRLESKDLGKIRISHRLSTSDAFDLTTRPLIIQISDSTLFNTEPSINQPIRSLELEGITKGRGYYSDDELVLEPMDFSERNYLPVSSLHAIMQRVFFPNKFSAHKRFDLDSSH